MTQNDPILLCDFGGTFGRIGIFSDKEIHELKKYKLSEFDTHIDVFEAYKSETGHAVHKVAVAAAEAHTETHFSSGFKQNTKVTHEIFQKEGYELLLLLNDFEASAWGAARYDKVVILKDGDPSEIDPPACLIGPGTGLGCAFIYKNAGHINVRRTSGGHVRPCAITKEQSDLIFKLQAKQDTAVIYEDFASGRGMEKVYSLLSNGVSKSPEEILSDPKMQPHDTALRLFHEFLGLYIQNVIVTSYAFGGVILHGGLVDKLYEEGLFDFETLDKMMCQPYVEVIAQRLEQVPVTYINDTYLALYGLKNYLEQKHA